ncbi:MAG: ATP-binding cassette domain-containing protein [Lachnospiraceae bacterium]|nr:ATP-binding cassette domain-containing protein [Lachnospiraceae bacterium]
MVLGKSTLSRIMAGIVKPNSGDVIINGINVKDKRKDFVLRKSIGIIFQNPENQIVFNTVYDDIAFGLKNIGTFENEKDRIREALIQVGMDKYIKADTNELSLGQKQRVAIAGVLAMNPKIILFDEPTTMLDTEGKAAIHEILKNLHLQGYTIVYITNSIDEILMAEKVLIMQNGEFVHSFKIEEILQNAEKLNEYNIELPLLVRVWLKLKEKNVNIDLSDLLN